MRKVIDANQDAEQVGLEIQAVALPSLSQIEHLMAADPAIVNFQVVIGTIHQQISRCQPGIT